LYFINRVENSSSNSKLPLSRKVEYSSSSSSSSSRLPKGESQLSLHIISSPAHFFILGVPVLCGGAQAQSPFLVSIPFYFTALRCTTLLDEGEQGLSTF